VDGGRKTQPPSEILQQSVSDNQEGMELRKKMSEEPVWQQLRRRKWNWIGHTLRRNDDSIARQVLQRMPQGHRGRGRPRNTWKRDLEREMWTVGFRFSWMNMETAAQDRAGWLQVVCGDTRELSGLIFSTGKLEWLRYNLSRLGTST